MSAFKAKYHGTCNGCGEHIDPEVEVVYVDDELVHMDCEGLALLSEHPVEVCPDCFLVRPCACEDGQ